MCSFGCYTAGWPAQSDFYHLWVHLAKEIGAQPLVDKYTLQFPVGDRMTYLWTACNEARACILLGDPLVRLDSDRLALA